MRMTMFEIATRKKIRFGSSKGLLSIEQLWDVPLRSKRGDFNLNEVAKAANIEVKAIVEENFVGGNTPGSTTTHLKLDLVKYVIETKMREEEAIRSRSSKKIEREKLEKILADKQEGALGELTEDQLKKRIEELRA